jgi:uncharacterized tellurite resistance protein B-like protein
MNAPSTHPSSGNGREARTRSELLDLYAMVIADSTVAPEELALLYERGRALGLTSADVDALITNSNSVPFVAPVDVPDAVGRLFDLTTVLHADGVVDPRELEVLRGFARRFGMPEGIINELVTKLVEEVRAGADRGQLLAEVAEALR